MLSFNPLEGGQAVLLQVEEDYAACWVKDGTVYAVGGEGDCLTGLPPAPAHLTESVVMLAALGEELTALEEEEPPSP
jgi:hypothetical protein